MRTCLAAAWVGVLVCAGCVAPRHARRGDRHLERGEYVSAIWEYGRALDGREDGEVALRRACAFRLMGDPEGADGDLERAALAGSVEAKALLTARRGVGDAASAEQLTRQHPDWAWTWALYGDSLLRSGRPKDAVEAYRTALAKGLDGDLLPPVLHNLALAQAQTQQYDAATETYRRYRALRGDRPRPGDHYLAGLLAYARGDHARAFAEWRQCPERTRAELRRTVGDERAFAGL